MMPMEERLRRQGFFAFAAYESLEPAWERVKQLVDSGRPMIYIERWMGSGDLKVSPGLRVQEGGFRPGAHSERFDDWAGFSVLLTPGIESFGISGHRLDGSEQDAANRFHGKRDGTRISVEGFGLGRGDHASITTWNAHGVGFQRSLYLQFEDADERADREGAFLDGLAGLGGWSPGDLRELAGAARYHWEPALDLARKSRTAGGAA